MPQLEYVELSVQQLEYVEQTPTPEKNTQGLGEQMQNSNEVTQWCPQIYVSLTSK